MKAILGAMLGLLFAAGCASQAVQVDRIGEAYWEDRLERYPTYATQIGDHRYDDQLADMSADAVKGWTSAQRKYLKRLERIDADKLDTESRLSRSILKRQLEDNLLAASCELYLMPLSHQSGPQLEFPLLLVSHPFKTVDDYQNYVARLRAFGPQVDQTIANCAEGKHRGMVPPRIIIEKVVPQLRVHIGDVDDSEFVKPLDTLSQSFTAAQREDVTREVKSAVEESVIPAYERLLAFVELEYLPVCRESVGIGALAGGDEMYDMLARVHTTTDMTVDEIHQIGLKEIERIRGEMQSVAREMGFDGDVESFIEYMRSEPKFKAQSGEALLAGFRDILARTVVQMPTLFGRLPKARCEVKEIEAFRAASAAAAYAWPPPSDGSHPGYFYVNTYRATERPTYTMEALTYHESYPGHHFQLTLDQENDAIPIYRRYGDFTAYIEGWGLYSESLGGEIGGYREPASRFGQLTYDAWRAARLVVDTGMHRYGWSRQKAIDYMKRNTGLSEVNIESEVDRYIAWPGQALAYKIGELTIQRVRRDAETRLGDRFDIRAFHDELLSRGGMPLSILESRMNHWTDQKISAK